MAEECPEKTREDKENELLEHIKAQKSEYSQIRDAEKTKGISTLSREASLLYDMYKKLEDIYDSIRSESTPLKEAKVDRAELERLAADSEERKGFASPETQDEWSNFIKVLDYAIINCDIYLGFRTVSNYISWSKMPQGIDEAKNELLENLFKDPNWNAISEIKPKFREGKIADIADENGFDCPEYFRRSKETDKIMEELMQTGNLPEIKPANLVEGLYDIIESFSGVTEEIRAHLIKFYATNLTNLADNHNRRIVAGEIKGPVLDPSKLEAELKAEYEKLRKERGG